MMSEWKNEAPPIFNNCVFLNALTILSAGQANADNHSIKISISVDLEVIQLEERDIIGAIKANDQVIHYLVLRDLNRFIEIGNQYYDNRIDIVINWHLLNQNLQLNEPQLNEQSDDPYLYSIDRMSYVPREYFPYYSTNQKRYLFHISHDSPAMALSLMMRSFLDEIIAFDHENILTFQYRMTSIFYIAEFFGSPSVSNETWRSVIRKTARYLLECVLVNDNQVVCGMVKRYIDLLMERIAIGDEQNPGRFSHREIALSYIEIFGVLFYENKSRIYEDALSSSIDGERYSDIVREMFGRAMEFAGEIDIVNIYRSETLYYIEFLNIVEDYSASVSFAYQIISHLVDQGAQIGNDIQSYFIESLLKYSAYVNYRDFRAYVDSGYQPNDRKYWEMACSYVQKSRDIIDVVISEIYAREGRNENSCLAS